jgi:GST-like protein
MTIFLEEAGLQYKLIPVNIGKGEQFKAEFLAVSPNNRIPAIVDQAPAGGGKPIAVFESGAILLYLAEKTGRLIPADPVRRYEAIQWVFFQMAGIGPMFGQVGFFHKFAGRDIADKRPLNRYVDESKRLIGVLEARLNGRQWFMDDEYTIADIAHVGWIRNLIGFYDAGDLVGIKDFPNVLAWLERALARPATQTGLNIPPRP